MHHRTGPAVHPDGGPGRVGGTSGPREARAETPARAHAEPDSRRFRLDIAYDGTGFSGWAIQPGLRTVCGTLTDGLDRILRRPVQLTVAGRTDAGVHATGQVAHVDLDADLAADLDPVWLVRRLARLLPADVRVRAVTRVPGSFDARFSALRRHYRYRVATAPYGAEPLRAHDTVSWPFPLDLDAVNTASAGLLGEHDFAAFCKAREGATTVRELQRLVWRGRCGHGRGVGGRLLPLDGPEPGRGAAGRRPRAPTGGVAREPAQPGWTGERGGGGPGARPGPDAGGLPVGRGAGGEGGADPPPPRPPTRPRSRSRCRQRTVRSDRSAVISGAGGVLPACCRTGHRVVPAAPPG